MVSREPAVSIAALDTIVRAMLVEDLPRQAADIQQALSQGDLPTATGLVHSVHGSAAFCQLDALRESAARLEADLKNNQKNAESVNAFEKNLADVLHALEHEKNFN